ncbi:hypothetical protein ACWENA_08165 [Streptomyces sp. NPDC004779]
MASERLTFTLEGRDDLSRVLGHAGESAQRLQATMEDASDGSGQAILTLTQDADGRLRDLTGRFVSAGDAAALMATRTDESGRRITTWAEAADRASKAGEALGKAMVTLAPAVLPLASSIAPLAASTLAAGAGIGVFGLAVKRQAAAMGEAVTAEQAYNDAVEESGRSSAEALQAQIAYAKQMAKLPPATRAAAASLSVMKDEYAAWSDSLAKDTTAPLIKGMGVLQGIMPKLTPTVRGAAEQLDRLATIAAGGVASPGFDGFMARVDQWSTGALTRAVDGLVRLLRTAESGQVSGGLAEFMAFAREQGPAVSATLQDLGRALLHVLDAGAEVGVGMLAVVQTLAQLVAAVPPELLTTLLQLAIAIRAVTLAAAGAAAARVAIAALGTSLIGMRTAAAAAPGPLAAAGAAMMTLSRTARLALLGTGIGVLALVIGEIAAAGEKAPIDVDKMTSSLARLGRTGELTGSALAEFGTDFGDLSRTIGEVLDPGVMETFDNWLNGLSSSLFDAGEATEKFTTQADAIDQALTQMVTGGKADLAAAALKRMLSSLEPEKADKLRSALDDYDNALANVAFEAELAADAQGVFGAQAQETEKKLAAQKLAADGLRQALHELNQTHLMARGGIRGMEAAIDAATEALEKNGRTLDEDTAKGRDNAQSLDDLATSTMKAVEAKYQETGSWAESMAVYDRGRGQLVSLATQMYGNEEAARRLANEILRAPNKTAHLKGNISDLEAKLATAKEKLKNVPDPKKAQVRADIYQLERALQSARGQLAALDGKTATTYVTTKYQSIGTSDRYHPSGGPGGFPKYARGTDSAASGWALVGEEGPELVRMKGGEQVFDHLTSKKMARSMADYPGLSLGRQVGAGLSSGMLQSVGDVAGAARQMAAGVDAGIRSELEIASPSRKTRRSGREAGRGVIKGLDDQKPALAKSLAALMKDLKDGIVRGLTGSKSQIQATAADLNADIWKAFSGGRTNKDSELVKMVNREHDKLQALATRRDKLKSQLSSAQDLLKSRVEEQARYRADVRSRAQDSASLSSLGLEPKEVTAGSIRAGLRSKLGQLKQFNSYITRLIKRGLHKSLLRQVIAMGPEDGLPYAAALLSMSSQDFKQTNQMQKDIDRESDSLGRAAAKTFYDAGVQSAQGLINGLKSQQKDVENQMVEIAKGMERALKRALGIKSPSRVAHAIGANFGQSTGDGVLSALPVVGRAVDAVAGRMASIRPLPGRPAAGLGLSGGGAGTTVYNITVQGAVDPVSTAKQIQTLLLKDKRLSGGNGRGFE